ncbi:ShKT domain-containing protein [Aphelenchoides fujianensis]|nr:ShKT domain-containing protein [Aphelenchoides fujianensis]
MRTEVISRPKYKVFQLNPATVDHLTAIHRLHNEGEYDFWKEPSVRNASAEIMIRPDQLEEFKRYLEEATIPFRVIVEDLAKVIAEKEGPDSNRNRALRLLLADGQKDESSHSFGLAMGEYYDYDELVKFMQRVHAAMPSRTRIVSIGKTVEGREMMGIQAIRKSRGHPPAGRCGLTPGIHAREWSAVHSAMYFIQVIANAVLDNRDEVQRHVNEILKVADIIIFPVANPDGYQYTRTDGSLVEYRMWRKNRSPQVCQELKDGRQRCCRGVDLNRNFAYKFSNIGTSFYPCSEIFHGSGAFSEPETKNIRDAVLHSDLRGRIQAFITMHAYSQLLIYPYSDRRGHYPEDVAELKKVANQAVIAIGDKFGTFYMAGTGKSISFHRRFSSRVRSVGPEIIYAYTGGSSDWAKESANIKYTYTIELRPAYTAWNGFVLAKNQLIPTARETFDGILVIADAVVRENPKLNDAQVSMNVVSTPAPPCADRAPSCGRCGWPNGRPSAGTPVRR